MIQKLALTAAIAGWGFCLTAQQSTQPAVYTAAQAEAGRTAFQSSCARCHTETLVGRDGTGDMPELARKFSGGKIPPLAGANAAFPPFMTKWGPQTTKALYDRLKVATPAFPPPDRKLGEELDLQLTAYILQMNGAKPGTQALTTDTAVEIRSIATGVAPQAPTTGR